MRVHWSAPLGALFVSRFQFAPMVWLGFVLLLLVHELGHAFLVRQLGYQVLSIDFAALGGVCRWSGSAASWERSWIAWGGVLAQLLLWFVTQLTVWLVGEPQSLALFQLVSILLGINLWLVVINLLPIPPLDGASAWKLPQEMRRAGISPKQLLLAPMWGWARRRKSARSSGVGGASRWRRRGASGNADGKGADEEVARQRRRQPSPPSDDEPQPSAEAQRELAALLERISKEAGDARKKTK